MEITESIRRLFRNVGPEHSEGSGHTGKMPNVDLNLCWAYSHFVGFVMQCLISFEQHHEKNSLWRFRPGPTQTRLYSYRSLLEA